jgi:aldose sugar dehydrogenase
MHRWPCALLLAMLAAMPSAGASALSVETLAAPLEHPWSLAFLPDGRILVSERPGRLRVVEGGVLRDAPVGNVPPVLAEGQGGLFEVLVDPQFEHTGRLYLSFTHGSREANATRVVRARLDGDRLVEVETLFTATPLATNAHYGGRMALLADGSLALGLGDGYLFRERAQRVDDTVGAIVRIETDGAIPPDNPFVGVPGADPAILSFGHRNVQGIAVHGTHVLAVEHGPRGGDELNLILPGANYGWPVASHGIDYSYMMLTPFTERAGMQSPLLQWTPSIASAGLMVYRGTLFPDWQGDLFVAALAERSVRRVPMRDGMPQGDAQEILLHDLGRRIRHVAEGPDGALYVLTDHADGALLRVVPATPAAP